jgi:hypothetical protein
MRDKQKPGVRLLIWLLLGIVLLATASATELIAIGRPQGNMLPLSEHLHAGLFGAEESATLPRAGNAVFRRYHWTEAQSRLRLWPAPAGNSLLMMEYLNPADHGAVHVRFDDHAMVSLEPSPGLRTLYVLAPAVAEPIVELNQRADVNSQGRQLGFLLSDVRWWGLPPTLAGAPHLLALRLAAGLPLTGLLLVALLLVLRARLQLIGAIVLAFLGGMTFLAFRQPWDLRAIQPLLQALLWWAILGVAFVLAGSRVGIRPSRRLMLGIWALTMVLFWTPTIGHDGVGYYAYVRSLLIDGDLHFANEFDPVRSPFVDTPDIRGILTATGYTPNPWSIGPALAWTPFWLLAHATTLLGHTIGLPWLPDGYAHPYVVLVTFASALAALATLLGCFVLARRWVSPATAVLATLTAVFGSNLLFYAMFEGSFAHSLSAAATTWFVVTTLRLDDQPTRQRWLSVGLLAGAMLLLYWINAILLLLPGLVLLRHAWRAARHRDWMALRRLTIHAAMAGGVALLLFTPQLATWRLLFGSWLTVPQGQGFVIPQQPRLGAVLFGPLYGLAWWTPAYLLGLLGSLWFAWRRSWPGLALLLPLLAFVLYNMSLPEWFANGGFGMRRFASLVPICAIGVAAMLESLRRVRFLPVALASAICGWGLHMTTRYVTYSLPHEPTVLMDLSLRAILLSPPPFPVGTIARLAQTSWTWRLLRSPDPGNILVLLVCLSIAGLLYLGWRVWRSPQRPVARSGEASHT